MQLPIYRKRFSYIESFGAPFFLKMVLIYWVSLGNQRYNVSIRALLVSFVG